MKVFVTGATGFIGVPVVQELIHAGHEVVGLARSEQAAKSLTDAGAIALPGDLEDLDSLRRGAALSDGVIHAGFVHDFSRFEEVCEIDRCAIMAIGDALAGSNRPFIVTSGTGVAITPGRPTTEEDDPNSPMPRVKSEYAASEVAGRGVSVSVVRLPQVHDRDKQGLISYLIAIAREKGVSAYVGEGLNCWPAVARQDAANLYKLAFDKAAPWARYNAVAEQGVSSRQIAETIGKVLKLPVVSKSPEEAAEHFGWMGAFMSFDMTASSALTQKWLDWHPTGLGLIHDLEQLNIA